MTQRKTRREDGAEKRVLAVRPASAGGEAEEKLDREGERAVGRVVDAVNQWVDESEAGQKVVGEAILGEIFDDDARAMVRSDRGTNPRYRRLSAMAGHGMRLTAGGLSVVVRITGFNHLVRGRYWKRLQPAVQRSLLPLADPERPGSAASLKRLNDAAAHCIDFDLDPEGATAYVREVRREQNQLPDRRATGKTYGRQLDASIELFGTPDALAHMVEVAGGMEDAERDELERKLKAAAEAFAAAAKALRRG